VRCVVVSSPGAAAGPHWSHAFTAALAKRLRDGGAAVQWFAAVAPGDELPPVPDGVSRHVHTRPRPPLRRVAAGIDDVALEVAITRALRADFAAALVHIGSGARASVHLTWLAERLGTAPFAVVRAAEVVCQRGDLVHGSGAACAEFLDPERCRRCCAPAWWRRPRALDFQNRLDLLVGGLGAAGVFVVDPRDVDLLERAGVPRRAIEVAAASDPAAAIAARVLAAGAAV
jgi:hypothetical protein